MLCTVSFVYSLPEGLNEKIKKSKWKMRAVFLKTELICLFEYILKFAYKLKNSFRACATGVINLRRNQYVLISSKNSSSRYVHVHITLYE